MQAIFNKWAMLWRAIVCRLVVLWVSLSGSGANTEVVEVDEEYIIFDFPRRSVARPH
jgi:hypothetical protein